MCRYHGFPLITFQLQTIASQHENVFLLVISLENLFCYTTLNFDKIPFIVQCNNTNVHVFVKWINKVMHESNLLFLQKFQTFILTENKTKLQKNVSRITTASTFLPIKKNCKKTNTEMWSTSTMSNVLFLYDTIHIH